MNFLPNFNTSFNGYTFHNYDYDKKVPIETQNTTAENPNTNQQGEEKQLVVRRYKKKRVKNRQKATLRERERARRINEAYKRLRQFLPPPVTSKGYTKQAILEVAASCIKREREGARRLNDGFERLRQFLPSPVSSEGYTKHGILEVAASYIETLENYVDWTKFEA